MSFTAVVACKGRLSSLQKTIPLLLNEMGVILVDWDCPEGSGDWAEALGRDHLQVVRARGEPYWHRSRALNLGARLATTDWLCFFDADTKVVPGLKEKLETEHGSFYVVQRDTPLTGILIVERLVFHSIGGYYEGMPGRGWQDVDLRCRLKWAGLKHRSLQPGLVSHLKHPLTLGEEFLPQPLEETLDQGKRALLRHMGEVTGRAFPTLFELNQAFPGLLPGT